MSRQDEHVVPDPLKPLKWIIVAPLALATILGLTLAIYFLWLDVPMLDNMEQASSVEVAVAALKADARRNALAVAAGLTAIAALLLTLRRQVHAEKQQQHAEYMARNTVMQYERDYAQREATARSSEDDALERRILELRVKAVDQLGSESPTVRIGGLHNLERIGTLYPDLRQTVIDEVCAYLRLSYAPVELDMKSAKADAGSFEPVGPPPLEIDRITIHEREVRLVAQEILVRHLSRDNDCQDYWDHQRLDLSGALLENMVFKRAWIKGGNFTNSIFGNGVVFNDAKFEGAAVFDGSQFRGGTLFERAEFGDIVWFSASRFEGNTRFTNATFGGEVWFSGATFEGGVGFVGTYFARLAAFEGFEVTAGSRLSSEAGARIAHFTHETTIECARFDSKYALVLPVGFIPIQIAARPGWVTLKRMDPIQL